LEGKALPYIKPQPAGTLVGVISSETFANTTTIRFTRSLTATEMAANNNDPLIPLLWAIGNWNAAEDFPAQHAFNNRGSGVIRAKEATVVANFDRERRLYAHAALMGLAFSLVLPLGVMAARFLRSGSPQWFYTHRLLQGLGTVMVVVAAALGLSIGSHVQYAHMYIGLGIIAAIILMALLGFCQPNFKSPKRAIWRSVFRVWVFFCHVLTFGCWLAAKCTCGWAALLWWWGS
jgi:hypothetical protein